MFTLLSFVFRMILFLDVAVTLLEAIYATCCVNELALTCVEWM